MRKRKYTPLPADCPELPAGAPAPVIHNIVSTARVECSRSPLDLTELAQLLPGSFYDRRRFAAMTVRLADPSCTVLLFSSGKMVVTGGRSWYDCVLSCMTLTRMLRYCMPGVEVRMVGCEIQNIVAHVEIPLPPGGRLNVDAMYQRLNLYSTYQKTMFPGLIYRPTACPIVLLCFDSGKVVLTGGKTVRDVTHGWAMQWDTVRAFVAGP